MLACRVRNHSGSSIQQFRTNDRHTTLSLCEGLIFKFPFKQPHMPRNSSSNVGCTVLLASLSSKIQLGDCNKSVHATEHHHALGSRCGIHRDSERRWEARRTQYGLGMAADSAPRAAGQRADRVMAGSQPPGKQRAAQYQLPRSGLPPVHPRGCTSMNVCTCYGFHQVFLVNDLFRVCFLSCRTASVASKWAATGAPTHRRACSLQQCGTIMAERCLASI